MDAQQALELMRPDGGRPGSLAERDLMAWTAVRDHIAALQSRIDALTADAAESERQLALYRKAINRMDDMTEYARPGLTREQLRVIFADLTAGLARQQEAAREGR